MVRSTSIRNTQGMTLVELLIAVAVLMLVFGGLMVGFQFIVTLIGSSKAQAGALSLANQRMEYIRSLPYDSVGTISGIPSGLLPQTSIKSLNAVTYSERILIGYVDDPKDGLGASDSNGILADYKMAKVEYSWDDKGTPKTISLISNIVPRGIETTAGGGTLTVNVFNAQAQPVSGASVRVYNNSGTTTIDTTRYTNINGIAMFSGAPARANYQITVTDTGFSTDQTYSASTSNPNPITPHVAVLESEVSTMNFQIDRLSTVTVKTIGVPTTNEFEDTFSGTTNIATSTSITVAGDKAVLSNTLGVYSPAGNLYSVAVSPSPLASWDILSYQAAIPTDTTLAVRVYDRTGTTTPTLIPDTDLPGNSAGFAPGNIDISMLDVSTYAELALRASFTTSNTATSSSLLLWNITYTESESALPSIPFTFTSSKTIGTDASAQPVYKYQRSHTTDGTGNRTLSSLEWGVYDVVVTGGSYDVAGACKNIPYALSPDVSETLTLALAPATARSIRVTVVDASGDEIPNADVTVSRSGFSDTVTSSSCGQAFFNSGLVSASDYDVAVQAYGYISQTVSAVDISGTESLTVTLLES